MRSILQFSRDLGGTRVVAIITTTLIVLCGNELIRTEDTNVSGGDESEKYVREHLKEFLAPADVKFLDDGRVRLSLKFKKDSGPNEKVAALFLPAVSSPKSRSTFRWALPEEALRASPGLRVSNKGAAHLKCWFRDDVEAEIDFFQPVSQGENPALAVVFTNKTGESIGSNYGKQCAFFRRGKLLGARGVKGSLELMKGCCAIKRTNKLRVKDGVFEVSLENKKNHSFKYSAKKFPSGRVGIIWGGGIAASVGRIEITGHLDVKRTIEEMKRKTAKKRRR